MRRGIIGGMDLFSKLAIPTSQPYDLNQGDAVEWLRSLPPGSVDLIITDPAYESLEKHRERGTTTRLAHSKSSSNDWFEIFRNERFPDFFRACHRALARDSHLYFLCDHETMRIAVPMAEHVGFKFWKPLIWDKRRIGMGYHYRARYEMILFFEKGKRKLADLGIPDILEVKRVDGSYPTEKPVELLEILVKQSSSEGQLVADPFMGSGSAGEASLLNGRRFAGNDLSPKSIEIAEKRLSQWRTT